MINIRISHYYRTFFCPIFLLVTSSILGLGNAAAESAFFYGANIPVDQLSIYQQIVVAPDQVDSKAEEKLFTLTRSKAIAYISVGEVAQSASYKPLIPAELISGYNPSWQSHIMDLSNIKWQKYLLEKHLPDLIAQGFDGFFLDTLDSYQLLNLSPENTKAYQDGLVNLVVAIRSKWPNLYLIANRGFEVMPQIATEIDELVAESLYFGFDPSKNSYVAQSDKDSAWLKEKLNSIQKDYSLAITVIDYLPTKRFNEAAALVKKITNDGFNSWVSNVQLDALGRGRVKPIARKILGIYGNLTHSIFDSALHKVMATPVEYLGYQLDYLNLGLEILPQYPLNNRYAGVIIWLSDAGISQVPGLCEWLKTNLPNADIKFAFISQMPVNENCHQLMGVKIRSETVREKYKVKYNSGIAGNFEAKIRIRRSYLTPIESVAPDNKVLLRLESSQGKQIDPVAIGPWGGYLANEFSVEESFNADTYWVSDPFKFLQESLSLASIPMPDTTTENGIQISTAHIDGDGIISGSDLPGSPLAGKVILNNIVRKYPLPHTVSIIEAETSPLGVYPKLSARAEAIAKETFEQANVEIASHTYSHPFYWESIGKKDFNKDGGYGTNLKIPGYPVANLRREIHGSVDYIDNTLSPVNKKTKVFLWSGNTLPPGEAIKLTKDRGLFNVNGGNTEVLKENYSLSRVWPIGLPFPFGYQVYAPIDNENVYTNLWHGPFFGYQNVIQTFDVLSFPRRLKPLSIYYHFYSGTKREGVAALDKVYNYVLSKPHNAMYLSQYAARAEGFYQLALGQDLEGRWHVSNAGALRTLRFDKQKSPVDFSKSDQVIGGFETPVGYYVHLSSDSAILAPNKNDWSNELAYLVNFNGQIKKWQQNDDSISFDFSHHGKFKLTMANLASACVLTVGSQKMTAKQTKKANQVIFQANNVQQGRANIDC